MNQSRGGIVEVRDEVCGMRFDAGDTAAITTMGGRTYHFCSDRCRRKFEEHPDWYVEVRPTPEEGPDHPSHG